MPQNNYGPDNMRVGFFRRHELPMGEIMSMMDAAHAANAVRYQNGVYSIDPTWLVHNTSDPESAANMIAMAQHRSDGRQMMEAAALSRGYNSPASEPPLSYDEGPTAGPENSPWTQGMQRMMRQPAYYPEETPPQAAPSQQAPRRTAPAPTETPMQPNPMMSAHDPRLAAHDEAQRQAYIRHLEEQEQLRRDSDARGRQLAPLYQYMDGRNPQYPPRNLPPGVTGNPLAVDPYAPMQYVPESQTGGWGDARNYVRPMGPQDRPNEPGWGDARNYVNTLSPVVNYSPPGGAEEQRTSYPIKMRSAARQSAETRRTLNPPPPSPAQMYGPNPWGTQPARVIPEGQSPPPPPSFMDAIRQGVLDALNPRGLDALKKFNPFLEMAMRTKEQRTQSGKKPTTGQRYSQKADRN